MRTLFTCIISLFCYIGFSQNESNIWYFGQNAGLDFNSGSPVSITGGQLSTAEGCATLSDADGNLLFYTDGMTVWDRQHHIMPNGTGLMGHPSATQSALIVPKPEAPDIYYIFTVTQHAGSEGARYSEVDISLNGGMGDITQNKNVLLQTPSCEKLTAVKHANGTDYWVVTHAYNNNSYTAFKISPAGVVSNPVSSSVGPLVNDIYETAGYLKFSQDGTKLMAAYRGTMSVYLFDFNKATGTISNPRVVCSCIGNYGIEFSESGNVAYVTAWSVDPTGQLYHTLQQFDLTAANIEASGHIVYGMHTPLSDFTGSLDALQMATDGKIYVSIYHTPTLGVINNPEILGTGCNFNPAGLILASGSCLSGLPQSSVARVALNPVVVNPPDMFSCIPTNSNTANFNLNDQSPPILEGLDQSQFTVTYHSTYADGNSGINALSSPYQNTANPETIFARVVSNQNPAHFTIVSFQLTTIRPPNANQPSDLYMCGALNNDYATFDLYVQDPLILGMQSPSDFLISYYLSYSDAEQSVNSLPSNYQSQENPQMIFARIQRVVDASCFSITQFRLHTYQAAIINIPHKFGLCAGDNVVITAPAGFDSYQWQIGQNIYSGQSLLLSEPALVRLTVDKDYGPIACESAIDIEVVLSEIATITDVLIQDGTDTQNKITIYAYGYGDYIYSVDGVNYQDSPVFNGLKAGLYTVYVSDKTGCGIATQNIYVLDYPKFFTPNGDGLNENWQVSLSHLEPQMQIKIFDRYGKFITSFSGSSLGWDGTYNGNDLPATDYWFVAQRENGKYSRGHFSLIR